MISVITPTYRRPEKLRRCLEAIAAQTYRDVEVVVVNDGGPSVRDVVSATLGVRIVLHEAETNRGHFACRNVGLGLASGDRIAFCDDDDTYAPGHLAAVSAAISEADLVYSGVTIRAMRPDGQVTMLPFSHPFDPVLLRKTNFIVPSSVLYERRLHDTLGPFDETAGPYWDWDWVLRVGGAGTIAHVPETSVTYEFDLRGGNLSEAPEKDRPFLEYLTVKHGLGPLPSTNFYLMALNDAGAGDTMHG